AGIALRVRRAGRRDARVALVADKPIGALFIARAEAGLFAGALRAAVTAGRAVRVVVTREAGLVAASAAVVIGVPEIELAAGERGHGERRQHGEAHRGEE